MSQPLVEIQDNAQSCSRKSNHVFPGWTCSATILLSTTFSVTQSLSSTTYTSLAEQTTKKQIIFHLLVSNAVQLTYQVMFQGLKRTYHLVHHYLSISVINQSVSHAILILVTACKV